MTTDRRAPPYGILPALFWESDMGRAIQAHGKDPVILSCYLRANRHATMLGYYRLRLESVLHDLPVLESFEAIRLAFTALQAVAWADFDEPSATVWIRDMARQRLNLAVGRVIDPEDGRRSVLQRLYDAVPPSSLHDPFFDAYGRALRLTRRTFAQPGLDDVPLVTSVTSVRDVPLVTPDPRRTFAHDEDEKFSTGGAGEGAPIAGTSTPVPVFSDQEDQEERDQVLRSVRTAAAHAQRLPILGLTPKPTLDPSREPNRTNYQVIEAVAWDLLRNPDTAAKYYEFPIEKLEDLVEATKRFCSKRHIDYGRNDQVPFDVVHRATASVWLKFTRPDIVSGASPRPRDLRK